MYILLFICYTGNYELLQLLYIFNVLILASLIINRLAIDRSNQVKRHYLQF